MLFEEIVASISVSVVSRASQRSRYVIADRILVRQLAYLLKSIIKSNLINGCPTERLGGRGLEYKKVGMFVKNFEIDQSRRGSRMF